jgi:UDP-glucose 4-epimerase
VKVHVTGVAGLIGSHLARRFLELGHEVSGSDNLTGGYRDNVPGQCKFWRADCTNLEAMTIALEGVDLVYHCAAYAHEGLSVFSPHTIACNIFNGSVTVFTAAIINKVRRVVHCSSMARYGAGVPPFREDDLARPQDPYGAAKLATETQLRILGDVYPLEWAIAVPHNVIGVGQKYDDCYRNVAGIMINRCLQGQAPVIYGTGQQQRCFTDISDALSCLEKMGLTDRALGEVVNIGPDEQPVTINELAALVMELTAYDGQPQFLPPRPQEVHLAYCSADKARRLLGYETRVTLRESLAKMVAWIRERGPRPFDHYLPIEIDDPRVPQTWRTR